MIKGIITIKWNNIRGIPEAKIRLNSSLCRTWPIFFALKRKVKFDPSRTKQIKFYGAKLIVLCIWFWPPWWRFWRASSCKETKVNFCKVVGRRCCGEASAGGGKLRFTQGWLAIVAKCIQIDPDAWGIFLTSKHGNAGVARKFVKFLSSHPNPHTWQNCCNFNCLPAG